MKGPITRRRERRILAALTHLGPLTEVALYNFLEARDHELSIALLNLADAGRIVCENRHFGIFNGQVRTWRLTTQEATDE